MSETDVRTANCPDCGHRPGAHHQECTVRDCGCDRSRDEWPDADVLALMRILAPVVEHRRHYGLKAEDAEVYARAVLAAGYTRAASRPADTEAEEVDGRAAISEWAAGKAAELRAKAAALRPDTDTEEVGTDG